jgi:hypothetical protein
MRADGVGLRCETDFPVESEDLVDVEEQKVVPRITVAGEETKFDSATKEQSG